MKLNTIAVNVLITATVLEIVSVLGALFGLCIALFGGLTATTVAVCTIASIAAGVLVYYAFEEAALVHVCKLYTYYLQPTSKVKEVVAGAALGLVVIPIQAVFAYVFTALGMSVAVATPVSFAISMMMLFMNHGYITLITKRVAA